MTLPFDTIFVWQANLATLDASSAAVSAGERQRAARFVRAGDRDRYLAVRGLLRRLLGRYLGCDPLELSIDYGPHGKPELKDSKVSFNLSHSASMALIAIGCGRAIGIDVEEFRERRALADMIRQLPATDRRMLEAVPAPERTYAFLAWWTRHEALVKAHGAGLSLPLADTRPLAEGYCCEALDVGVGHVAALAVERVRGAAPLKIVHQRVS